MKNMRDEIILMASDQEEKEAKSQALLNQVAALSDTLTRYAHFHVHVHTHALAHAHVSHPLLTRRLSNPSLQEPYNFTARILILNT